MLPGFRSFVAATVLTVSLLIFGFGAAALLRASHERFAGLLMRPPQAEAFARPEDVTPPTLAILRVEPAPVEVAAPVVPLPVDTLLPTDRLAALNTAQRSDDIVVPPLIVEQPTKIEPTPEPPIQAMVETIVPPPVVVPAEPVVTAKTEEPAVIEQPVAAAVDAPQQVAALPEPDITTGGIAESVPADLPLVNAKPIRRPPLPTDRPAAADAVAAMSAPDRAKPIIRKRKPVVNAVVSKKRVVARPPSRRPAATAPASPFGASGLGGSPFGT